MAVDGELRDRAVGVALAHHRLEVGPDRVGALGEDPVALVEHLVEDRDALVGQPHLVGVGVHQRPAHRHRVPVLDGGVELAADVLDRLLHGRQLRLEPREDRCDGHANTSRDRGGGRVHRTTGARAGPIPHIAHVRAPQAPTLDAARGRSRGRPLHTAARRQGRDTDPSCVERRALALACVTLLGTVLALAEIPPPETAHRDVGDPRRVLHLDHRGLGRPLLARPGGGPPRRGAGRDLRGLSPRLRLGPRRRGRGWRRQRRRRRPDGWRSTPGSGAEPGWAPTTAVANVGLLVVSGRRRRPSSRCSAASPTSRSASSTGCTLWWVIRGTVYAYVGGVTFLGFVYARRRPEQRPRAPLGGRALVPMAIGCSG